MTEMTQSQVDDQITRPTSPLTHEQKERVRAQIKSGDIVIVASKEPLSEDVAELKEVIKGLLEEIQILRSEKTVPISVPNPAVEFGGDSDPQPILPERETEAALKEHFSGKKPKKKK
tara:strand:+ start:612 stop:962 length:351 start_codon:yes stop_codon:yes gene_type:complete